MEAKYIRKTSKKTNKKLLIKAIGLGLALISTLAIYAASASW
jgi:hypothetical protein